jgi:hypothetical protein
VFRYKQGLPAVHFLFLVQRTDERSTDKIPLRTVIIAAKPSTVAVEKGITLPKGYQAAKDLNLVDLNPGIS